MGDRFWRGWEILSLSWEVLRSDKQLLVFPILSFGACMLVLLSYVTPFLFIPGLYENVWRRDRSHSHATSHGAGAAIATKLGHHAAENGRPIDGRSVLAFGIGFSFYFLNFFVAVFFNVALAASAIVRFRGGEPTIGDGLRTALARLPQILAWTLIAASVGTVLRVMKRGHFLRQIVVGSIGVVWSVAIYFVVPILAVEKKGPIEAIKRSTQILSKVWGESAVGNCSISMTGFVLALPGMLLAIAGIAVGIQGGHAVVGAILFVLALVYIVTLSVVLAALQQIFVAGAYLYAAKGVVADEFSEDTFKDMFIPS